MSVKIKICGITRPADAEAVVSAGADALGFNFAPESPRFVADAVAAGLSRLVGPGSCRVGLFMDAPAERVRRVLDQVDLDLLQFHGDEPPDYCAQFGVAYMKVFRVRSVLPMPQLETAYGQACCFLLDTYVEGVAGGTGQSFDWSLWPRDAGKRLVLAGGLTPGNVGAAIAATAPYGVDVSGGVEGPVKGVKDPDKIRQFVAEVRRAGIQ